MKFLFLSNCRFPTEPWRDASTRYRAYHLCEELVALGHIAHVAHIDTVTGEQLTGYDLVSFVRPRISRQFNALFDACRQLDIKVIADFDDLNFSTEAAASSPAVESGYLSAEESEKHANEAAEALLKFNTVTTATATLAAEVRRVHSAAQTHVIANGLSRYWLESNATVHKTPQPREHAVYRLGYLPGSRGHDHDFALFTPLMKASLLHQPNLHLEIIGALNLDPALSASNRFTHRQAVPFNDLPHLIAGYHATLAPLADNRFNRCKSHIKFIESAAFGTPVIASAIPDMARHESVNGLFLIRSSHDWAKALTSLNDPLHYRAMTHELRDYVREHCTARIAAIEWLSMANIIVGDNAPFINHHTARTEDAAYDTHNTAVAR